MSLRKASRGEKFQLDYSVSPEGVVEARCIFLQPDGSTLERVLPVEQVRFHWEMVYDLVTKELVGKRLRIDGGYVTLHDQRAKYFAEGTPPLWYRWDDPEPLIVPPPQMRGARE